MKKHPTLTRIRKRLREAVRQYTLIAPDDKVLIGLSGGKDSLALVALLGELRRHYNRNFHLEAVHVKMSNIKYEADFDFLKNFCDQAEVPFKLLEASFKPDTDTKRTPCFLCSWTRRKALFEYAQQEHFNKIALGHHQDDILKTAMMNLTYSGSFSTMPVLLRLDKMPITIIRPLCLQHEQDLRELAALQHFRPLQKECPYDRESTRNSIDEVLSAMERLNPESRYSLWHALEKEGKLVESNR